MSDFFATLQSDPNAANTWTIVFWVTLLSLISWIAYRVGKMPKGLAARMSIPSTPSQPEPTPAPALTAEEQAAKEKEELELKETRIRSYQERLKKGRSTLPVIEYVDFDWRNKEHARALDLLMQEPARLHPTLRFHFDPAVVENAYMAMLMAAAHQHINRINAPKKAITTKKPVAAKKAPSSTDATPKAVIPLRKQHNT